MILRLSIFHCMYTEGMSIILKILWNGILNARNGCSRWSWLFWNMSVPYFCFYCNECRNAWLELKMETFGCFIKEEKIFLNWSTYIGHLFNISTSPHLMFTNTMRNIMIGILVIKLVQLPKKSNLKLLSRNFQHGSNSGNVFTKLIIVLTVIFSVKITKMNEEHT